MESKYIPLVQKLNYVKNYKGLMGKAYQDELRRMLDELSDEEFADFLTKITDLRDARIIASINLSKRKYFMALDHYKELREKQKEKMAL